MSSAIENTALALRLAAMQDLGGHDADILKAFGHYLVTAPDEDLFRLSPLRYAQVHEITQRQAIDLFLYATHAGILEANWGVVCPTCYAFVNTPGGLHAITSHSYCHLCDLEFDVSVDENVEVAFTVAPAARKIRFHDIEALDFQRDWITWSYSSSRYYDKELRDIFQKLVEASSVLKPHDSITLTPNLSRGTRYHAVTPSRHAFAHIIIAPDAETREVTFEIFDGRIVPDQVTLKPGAVTLHFVNRSESRLAVGVVLDGRTGYPELTTQEVERVKEFFNSKPTYLTAKQVATSQVFREQFRAESIPSQLGLAFKSVTFLFSDLKGSTALYQRVGDIRAYEIVREHFTLLRDIIAEFGGAVVKTMGDAVMASFADPMSALEAAIVISREIARVPSDEALILKIGVHMGSCIAVESNERLDYFGQTVNLAARVQSIAAAGEIVVTQPIYESPGAQDLLRSMRLTPTPDSVYLRGIDGITPVYRLS